MRARAANTLLFAVAAASLIAACKKPPPEETTTEPSIESPPPASKPVDHLASDELVEGGETAFGVKLPRVLDVTRRYDDEVHATATAPIGRLVAYFKAHLREAKVTTRARSATLEKGKVPERPGELVDVRIDAAVGDKVEVVIRSATPPPPSPLPDEESRRRAAGLTPDGKRLLDPSHVD